MGVFTRRIIKENLDQVDVFLQDNNNEIFVVQDIPDTFVQGRTAFKIFGSNLLLDNVPLKIEILDKSGETVYVQPIKYGLTNPKLPYRHISVEVYREINVPGEAKLVILGELDPSVVNVPQQFQGRYNVKYSKVINIDTFSFKNTQPILFYKKPTFTARESVVARKKVNPVVDNFISGSQIFGKVKDDLRGQRFGAGYQVNTQTDTNEGGKADSPTGDVKAEVDTYKYKTGLFGKKAVLSRRGIKEDRASEEPPQMKIFSNERPGPFNAKMVGGTINVRNIQLTDSQKQNLSGLSPNSGINPIGQSEINERFSTDGSSETIPDFSGKIERVVNDHELYVSKPYSVDFKDLGAAYPVKIYSDIGIQNFTAPNNASSGVYSNFTASFVDWSVPSTSSFHFDSFVDINLKNLRTFSGDIYRIKAYGASDESTADFPVLLDTVIESPELLRDTTSPSGFLRSGYFRDQTHTDKYWNGFGGNNQTTTFTNNYTSSLLIDSVFLSGSYESHDEVGRFELNSTYSFTLQKDVPYTLSFRAKGKRSDKNNEDGSSFKSAKLLFHLSGSNITDYDGKSKLKYSGSFGSTITNETGQLVGLEIDDTNKPSTDEYVDFGLVNHTFFPKFKLDQQTNTDTILQLRVHSGYWAISELSLRPAQDTGFSPDEFSFRVPIPPGANNSPNNFDFLVEYYDVDGNVAETSTFINNVQISGSALIIQGSQNMLTGSLFLGNLQGSGIEMRGGSAYIRAVGYTGFKNAQAGTGGGFFMWSGSVAPGDVTQDSYTGAGLEIHDGNTGVSESFFKFRTKDADNVVGGVPQSTFDIKTSRFFLGNSTSNFISGSNSKIEISSSNFHLQNNGDVIMQGTITAEAGGTIGGFTIGSDNLTSTNFVLNTTNKSLTLGNSNTIFIADADTGIQLGNATFASAPFSVTTEGVLKAESGTIGGFTLGSTTLTGGKLQLLNDGTIQSEGFQNNVAGSGFQLTANNGGFLEVENASIRGTLKTTVFEKETVNAVGGQLYIANSTVLTGSNIAPGGIHTSTQTTMSVENVSGFVPNEILSIKKVSPTGFGTEYVLVNSSSRNDPSSDIDLSGNIMVTRGFGSGVSGDSGSLGDSPGAAQSYSGSQVIVSTGKPPNTGYMRLNANPNDPTTPYMDIVERTGSGIYDIQLKTRLGDLSGVAGTRNVPSGFEGFGLMSEVAFLSGSQIKLEAPTFLLGDRNSNFISGSNGNLSLTSQTFNLNTTSTKLDSSNGGALGLGPTAPTNLTSSGVFLSGSGEFNLQQSQSYFRGDKDGIEISFPNFSVTKTGTLTANDGNFNGRIEAESGFFGTDSSNGWTIDSNKIKSVVTDASKTGSIEIDATPTSPNISLTSGSFVAEIVPDFTTATNILAGGGITYNNGTFTSGSSNNGTAHTSNVTPGNTSTGINLFTAYSNETTSTFGTSVPTQNTGSNGFGYRSSVAGQIKVTVATPNFNELGFNLLGSFRVQGEVQLYVNNSLVSASITTINTSITPGDSAFSTLVRTINFSGVHSHTLAGNHNLHWKVENLRVTNNSLREEIVLEDSGGNFLGTQEIDANITRLETFFTDAKHIVSNRKTELAPAGIQLVNLSSETLNSEDNTYFRVAAAEDKRIDILNKTTTVTGSIKLCDNAVVGSGFVSVPTGSKLKAGYRFNTRADSLGFTSLVNNTISVTLTGTEKFRFDAANAIFHADNDIIAFSNTTSDKRFKKNVIPISNGLDKVLKLRGVEFDWKDEYKDKGHDLGFIAQEVEEVSGLEPLVSENWNIRTDEQGVKTVSYEKVIPVLVEAVKEQQKQIDELKKKLEEL